MILCLFGSFFFIFNWHQLFYATDRWMQPQGSDKSSVLSPWECWGYFLFTSRSEFDQATEEALLDRLAAASLDDAEFQGVKQFCCHIVSEVSFWFCYFISSCGMLVIVSIFLCVCTMHSVKLVFLYKTYVWYMFKCWTGLVL